VKKEGQSAVSGFQHAAVSVGSSGMSTEQILEAARGYKRLGLFDQARAECEMISENDSSWLNALELLLGIDLCQERMTEAAKRGVALLASGSAGTTQVLFAVMALHQSGNSREAFDSLMAHHRKFVGDTDSAYSFACYAAPVGEIDFAIKALLFNYRNSKYYWPKSCLDADLEPIWIRAAAGNISLDSSVALAHPVIGRALETSADCPKEIPIDYVIKSQVPENCRGHLRIHPGNGFYTLHGSAPLEIREKYLEWQKAYKARTMSLAGKAIQLAKEVVLDHQLEWAVQKAKAGNLIGARYHVLFALSNRPKELQRFAQELRPLGLRYFFDELLYAASFDPDFCVKLRQVALAQDAGQFALALDLLDEIPAHLQSLPICLLPRANNENRRGYRHFATKLYKIIARRWPQDPVGYFNTIENLMEDENWDEASQVFGQAPEGYRILALSQMQCTRLDARSTNRDASKAEVFYGQPDWDERLRIIPATEKVLFQLGK
jgi:hypothetical protein